MNIRSETISGMTVFKDEILNTFLLHIPHASIVIPNDKGFIMDKIEENIHLLTDWATDKIFDVQEVEKIVTPYSRLFCDVERFEDEGEPMADIGRGFFYTNGYDGSALRMLDNDLKAYVYNNYYLKHHQLFYEKVKEKLEKNGVCNIIDCHSFNDNPLVPFIENTLSPDICIGTDVFHTPKYLSDHVLNHFKNLGYSVEINNPYSGCIIPKQFYLINKSVKGIMIEINKRLYMEDGIVNEEKVNSLRKVLNDFFHDL